jgi:hypothetical protein
MASSLLANLRRTEFPESVWSRFAAGRAGTITWYAEVSRRLRAAGFAAPIMSELDAVVRELESYRTKD